MFTNHSSTCSYSIGLAVYKKYSASQPDQELYDYRLAVIPPNSTLTLSALIPTCAYQAYAFYGSLLESFSAGGYGSRQLGTVSGNGTNYCSSACRPTVTPTATGTPCDVCNIYYADANIRCNPDGSVHWSFVMQNNGTCTVTVPVRVQLQTRNGYSGSFTAAETVQLNYSFPPGRTTVQGDICHHFGPTETVMNIYTKVNSPCLGGNADHLSPFINTCSPNPTCIINRSFTDVKETNPFAVAINGLVSLGAASGYSDNTFRPGDAATREQAASVLVRAFELPLQKSQASSFSDVSSTSLTSRYIEAAYSRGILSGYADGTFRPGNAITRGELAMMVVKAAGWKVVTPAGASYSDVSASSMYYRYIETARVNGVLAAYTNAAFGPTLKVTRGEVAQMVMLAVSHQKALYPDGVRAAK